MLLFKSLNNQFFQNLYVSLTLHYVKTANN